MRNAHESSCPPPPCGTHPPHTSIPCNLPGHSGSVKGLTCEQLQELDCHVILGNTYHLGNRPGPKLVDAMGGLHKFINWPRGMLTDSGGFQMVSAAVAAGQRRGLRVEELGTREGLGRCSLRGHMFNFQAAGGRCKIHLRLRRAALLQHRGCALPQCMLCSFTRAWYARAAAASWLQVSLLHLADITEEGVTFQSPVDGSRMLLTPEESISIQNDLGA